MIAAVAVLAVLGQPAWRAMADGVNPASLALPDARALASSSQRARSVVLELRRGPLTVAELNRRIPPSDPEWTQGIVWDVESLGWIAPTGAPNTYGLTERGRRMLAAMETP